MRLTESNSLCVCVQTVLLFPGPGSAIHFAEYGCFFSQNRSLCAEHCFCIRDLPFQFVDSCCERKNCRVILVIFCLFFWRSHISKRSISRFGWCFRLGVLHRFCRLMRQNRSARVFRFPCILIITAQYTGKKFAQRCAGSF